MNHAETGSESCLRVCFVTITEPVGGSVKIYLIPVAVKETVLEEMVRLNGLNLYAYPVLLVDLTDY